MIRLIENIIFEALNSSNGLTILIELISSFTIAKLLKIPESFSRKMFNEIFVKRRSILLYHHVEYKENEMWCEGFVNNVNCVAQAMENS